MNSKPEYISVSQYAKIKGISPQAVYKKLNNELKPFVKLVNGKKSINIAALSDEEKEQLTTVEQPFQPKLTTVEQLNLTFYEKQIEEQNKTIEQLLKQIDTLQEQNGKLTDIVNNSLLLSAMDKKMLLEQGAQGEEQETPQETPKDDIISIKPKKRIFDIFRKKH